MNGGWLNRRRQTILVALLAILAIGAVSLGQTLRLQQVDDRVKSALPDGTAAELQSLTAEYQALHRTEYGLPYVYDFDSYYFLAQAAGISAAGWSPFVLLERVSYQALHAHDARVTHSDAAFFLPFAFGLLTLVAFFFLALNVTGSIEAAFFAGIILSLQHRFFAATAAGMGDTQSINLFFSVVFVLLVFLARDAWHAKQKRTANIVSALAVLTLVLFAATWNGAPYILVVIAAGYAGVFALRWLKTPTRSGFVKVAVMAVVTAGLALAFFWKRNIWYVLFPDKGVLTRQIAELSSPTLPLLALSLGGKVVFGIALLVFALLTSENYKKSSLKQSVILAWFVLLVLATLMSVRFVYYALPATAILAGIGFQQASSTLRGAIGTQWWKRAVILLGCVAVIGLLLVPNLITSQHSALPQMQDGMVSLGKEIDAQAAADARIITWWDTGHLWRYAAKREPFLDGKGQAPRTSYWLTGRSFLTQNVSEALNGWSSLLCMSPEALQPRRGDAALFAQRLNCSQEGVVIVDERLLKDTPALNDLVHAYESSFAMRDPGIVEVQNCARAGELLECGSLTVNFATMTANGVPVRVIVNGTRRENANDSEQIVVVYTSGNGAYALDIPRWFSETVLVRLFTGESLELRPVAAVDDPARAVAYRVTSS